MRSKPVILVALLVQPGLEGGLADPGDLGGLLGGQSLDVTQHEGGPQRGRQLG